MEDKNPSGEKDVLIKVYNVNDKLFVVPKEITHRQYFRIAAMFKELGIKTNEVMDKPKYDSATEELDLNFKAGSTLNKLLAGGKIPEFFATILIPDGERIWKEEFLEPSRKIMEDIGDVTALEVVQSFLSGRADLIVGLWGFFNDFMKKNEGLIGSLNSLTQKDEVKENLVEA